MTRRRATAYLLATLGTAAVSLLALPVLCLPGIREPWARANLRLAGNRRWHPVRLRRHLLWLAVHAGTGLPLGLFAVLVVGNLVTAVIAMTLWWAFPPAEPVTVFVEVPVTGWAVALGLGPVQLALLTAVTVWAFPVLAGAHARLTRWALTPSEAERLATRVADLTRTRADVLDAHSAELRRIERDLHDGAQARLVAVAMRLAVAKQRSDDPELVNRLVAEAHEGTEEAMVELRAVIRNTYPPILADRSLAGALVDVAARSGLPTTVDVADLGRVPAAVESVAYFAVTEALSNVTRHSRAGRAGVRASRSHDLLTVTVTDDGAGGADEARGTGLAGIRRRAGALDGTLTVRSPAGGPTEITLEVPCSQW
ncbi:sensor histidine kinase [Virgisporangium ochraceum]